MPRAERRSHGCHTGCGERQLKAASRRRRERDSARLEPAIDAADPSAVTSTLDLQDSRFFVDCRNSWLGRPQILADLLLRGLFRRRGGLGNSRSRKLSVFQHNLPTSGR